MITYVQIPLQDWDFIVSTLQEVRNHVSAENKGKLLTIKEVHGQTGKSIAAIRQWIDSGKLPAITKTNGTSKRRTILVKQSDLDKYLNANKK